MSLDYIERHKLRILSASIGILIANLTAGCAALPAAAGYFTSGGVTVYKSAKENGPKAEFVLFKTEINHIVYQTSPTK